MCPIVDASNEKSKHYLRAIKMVLDTLDIFCILENPYFSHNFYLYIFIPNILSEIDQTVLTANDWLKTRIQKLFLPSRHIINIIWKIIIQWWALEYAQIKDDIWIWPFHSSESEIILFWRRFWLYAII